MLRPTTARHCGTTEWRCLFSLQGGRFFFVVSCFSHESWSISQSVCWPITRWCKGERRGAFLSRIWTNQRDQLEERFRFCGKWLMTLKRRFNLSYRFFFCSLSTLSSQKCSVFSIMFSSCGVFSCVKIPSWSFTQFISFVISHVGRLHETDCTMNLALGNVLPVFSHRWVVSPSWEPNFFLGRKKIRTVTSYLLIMRKYSANK